MIQKIFKERLYSQREVSNKEVLVERKGLSAVKYLVTRFVQLSLGKTKNINKRKTAFNWNLQLAEIRLRSTYVAEKLL